MAQSMAESLGQSQLISCTAGGINFGRAVAYEIGTGLGLTVGGAVGGLLGGMSGWCQHMAPIAACTGRGEVEKVKKYYENEDNQTKANATSGEGAAAGAHIVGTVMGIILSIPMALAFGVAGCVVGIGMEAGGACCNSKENKPKPEATGGG